MSQDGYVTDVPYMWDFQPDFSPRELDYVSRMSGCRPAWSGGPLRFLELGCGNGATTATYAACNPEGDFHGVDFNPEHIRNARAMAEAGGVSNATFHEASFEQLIGRQLGRFHFVALHGVLSWVGPVVRAQLIELIRSVLEPGGLIYVSYNTMPGWAPLLPLRQMMLDYTIGMDVPTVEKVREGLAYLKFLRDNGAGCFVDNAPACSMLDTLLEHDARYVAHEFFPEHWKAFWFQEVAGLFAEGDMHFVGCLPSRLNIEELTIPEAFQGPLATAEDRIVYEIHKSFVTNEMFRRDVYRRPIPGEQPPALMELWGHVVFQPLVREQAVAFGFDLPVGEVRFDSPLYGDLNRILQREVLDFAALCEHPELTGYPAATLLTALHVLCAGHQFASVREPPRPPVALDVPLKVAGRFNRSVLRERLLVDGRASLASPVTGNGVIVDGTTGLAIRAHVERPEDPATWAWELLEREGTPLRVGGVELDGAEAHLRVLRRIFSEYGDGASDRLVALGILEPE